MAGNRARAWRIYKYLSLIYAVGFLIWGLIDDYPLYSQYWRTAWAMYLGIWCVYLFLHLVFFSFFYWLVAVVFIIVYRKPGDHSSRP